MHIDQGSFQLKSWGGALCSVILFTMIGAYSLQKLDVLINKLDAELITMTKSNALKDTDVFDSSMGFNIAAAFTAYDSKIIDDPTIGELVFNHYKWGVKADGSNFSGRYRLKAHRCTQAELGLVQNDAT